MEHVNIGLLGLKYWRNSESHISRIEGVLKDKGTNERKLFDEFLDEIRDDLNPEITKSEAIEITSI